MLCKVVLPFESVHEILKCDHSNESYWAVLSYGAFCFSLLYKMKLEKKIILGFSEPKQISHDNDDCGDGDDKRYLNLKVFSKACCWLCMGIFVEHKLMCFVYFISGRTFSQERRLNRRSKRIRKEEKVLNWSNGTKIRFHFCIKMIPLKDGGRVWPNYWIFNSVTVNWWSID